VNLARFFSAIEPFLNGRAGHAEAVRALYGEAKGREQDARRLAIYGEFCQIHRGEALGGVHVETRKEIERLGGEPLWGRLVQSYFAAHPMRHAELNENGAQLAAFLRDARLGLPAWVWELADLEWWEWRTLIAPGGAEDEQGPLRIAGTAELRPYAHDLVAWLDSKRETVEPVRRSVIVLFWRDRELAARQENASAEELHVLKLVHEGARPPDGETLDDLREAGILLGEP
jgi:hypothetical protein